MAAISYCPKLSGSKFKNWITAGLAVLFTKEGIEPFVYDEIEEFQQKCLSDICNNNGLPAGTTCSNCCTENVVVCPTNRLCNVGRGQCSFHRNSATQYLPFGCPNKICHNFKNEIRNAHRFFGPSFKNTDATQWCRNPWEVAKCFMPPDGYKDVTNAAETDFNGIISVIKNYKDFQSKINDDLSKTNNIFEQGREVGKAVRHSAHLEVEDTDLQQYFSTLQTILSDPTYLSANTSAQNAKTKLSQLQNDTLIIGKDDVRKVLDDVAKAVQDRIRTEMDEHKKEAEKKKLELIDITNESVKAVDRHGNISMAQLDKALKSANDEIEKQTKESVKKVQAEAEKQLKIMVAEKDAVVEKVNEGVKRMEVTVASGVKTVTSETNIATRKIKEETDEEIKRFKTEASAKASTLETEANNKVKTVASEAGKAVKQIEGTRDDGVKGIQTEVVARIRMLASEADIVTKQIKESADKGVNKLEVEAEAGVARITSKTAEALKQIEESTTANKEVKYNKFKEELKDDLASFYTETYSTIPLSPLFQKHDTPLVDFYMLPKVHLIERKMPAGEETKTVVKSLSDVFKSEKSCEIYLTADAGFGKTAFSKYLALTWCQAHRPEKEYKKYFSEDAINAMRDFEFLFLLLLRDSSDDCSIDDLIVKQILQNLSRSSAMTIDFLQEVLHHERCLVILDGLDEWTHPEKKCAKVPKTIPHRNARKKCVILTTTRPWKLGVLNLSKVDREIELVKLTSESAQTLEERAISKIKNIDLAEAKTLAKQLNEKIKENKLEDLESVPLLTMYLICLWCDDIPLGQSKCGLYASIIELLLSRTISKYPEMEQMCESSQSDMPQCFIENKHCTMYCTYLKALGQLAFETLFSETKESTLVFNKSVADKFLTQDHLKLSLHSGLLTQSTETKLTKQCSKISFSHKTVQEFFCALYLCCQNESDVKKIFLMKCKSLQNILDMSTEFVFISGMVNADIISSISREFMSVISENKITTEYRSTTDWYHKPLKDIQDMYISCIKETTDDLKICCQDFFFSRDCKEEKYFSCLKSLAEHNKSNMESIFIDTEVGPSLGKIIDGCALISMCNINKIYYNGFGEEAQLPVLLKKTMKCVSVLSSGDFWTREMYETLQNNSLLQAIHISFFWMTHDVLNDFLNFIMNRKTMTEIRFSDVRCIELFRRCTFSLDFCQHSDLRKLEVGLTPKVSQLKVNSQVKHVELSHIDLGEMLLPPEMANIELFELFSVSMSASTFRDLVKVVEKLSHKVTVDMFDCKIIPETESEDVKKYVHSSQNFRVTEEGLKFVFVTKVESHVIQ